MSRKLAYDLPRITPHGDMRELTRAGVSRSLWARTWMPGVNGDAGNGEEPGLSYPLSPQFAPSRDGGASFPPHSDARASICPRRRTLASTA